MALTGIEIYKLLPKTNCGDCGVPTCLAFAMALAAGKTELDKCPRLSEEVRAQHDVQGRVGQQHAHEVDGRPQEPPAHGYGNREYDRHRREEVEQ